MPCARAADPTDDGASTRSERCSRVQRAGCPGRQRPFVASSELRRATRAQMICTRASGTVANGPHDISPADRAATVRNFGTSLENPGAARASDVSIIPISTWLVTTASVTGTSARPTPTSLLDPARVPLDGGEGQRHQEGEDGEQAERAADHEDQHVDAGQPETQEQHSHQNHRGERGVLHPGHRARRALRRRVRLERLESRRELEGAPVPRALLLAHRPGADAGQLRVHGRS